MSFSYSAVSENTNSLNSGSYLTESDSALFKTHVDVDLWFATSQHDAIEVSAYDLKENLISWKSMTDIGQFTTTTYTYYDSKNNSVPYVCKEYVCNRELYRNEKILVNPEQDFRELNPGSYTLSYFFTRYLAGTPTNPLIIKDVSPNRTEIKLVPGRTYENNYTAFCLGKIQLNDVVPLYIRSTADCPYSSIFESSKSTSQTQIDMIKNMFFIPSDGKFLEFLKGVYEDEIKYSTLSEDAACSLTRTSGIRSNFRNYLLSAADSTVSFDDIYLEFNKCVRERLDTLFVNYTGISYASARNYLTDLFSLEFFKKIHDKLSSKYNEKYKSPLKNAVCFGDGKYLPILSTSYLDERTSDSEPLTLLVKLQSPISTELSSKSSVWVSNISMMPVLFDAILKNTSTRSTVKIAPADFTSIPKDVSFANTNTYFTSEDLTIDSGNEVAIELNKKLDDLGVDYSQFENFVVFSSAELRHNIFKNKVISLSGISSSLSTLESSYSSSGYTYPYYSDERESYEDSQKSIFQSFDGFESYLYKTGNYLYLTNSQSFYSSSFVELMDENSKTYDKYNRDSLVNNTPEHIILDVDNDDYLIFLSMIGHYFDNLFVYIKSLPSEKSVSSDSMMSKVIIKNMLQSFGWNLSDAMDLTSISDSFLDTSSGGTNEISAENKTRQIWNRILTTLPLIYKTKGTEECIRLVLSCHGIPTTLIGIREYGGVDYSNTDKTSYTIDEKLFMLTFSGYRDYLSVPYDTSTKTVEFKVAFDSNRTWEPYTTIPLAVKYNQNDQVDWSVSAVKSPTKHTGKIYFTISGSQMSSSALPIFNGDIFNIMIRRNLPDDLFEYNSTPDIVPTKYDLWVQRADDGRTIYSSSVDSIYQKNENISFSNSGTLFFGNYSESSSFFGILDKILIWDSPIADNTFDDHCNNLSSYSYTGSSVSHETLKYRMHVEYPADLSTTNPSVIPNANEYYSSSIFINAHNFGLVTYSASFENCAYVSHSVYPYQFREVPYEQTFTITSYGPNKFKNQKVQRVSLETAARFDPNERSTYSTNKFVSPDSNRIGLFADPNSNKNTDIFRYLGDYGVSSLIASPEQLYEDRYYPLKNVRELYNRSGNKRVLYNEILTLYKFYFDKSIFDTIKQLIPARNITLTGVLIEPTVLERPKYQHKRIVSETSDLEYTSSAVTIVTSSNQTRPQTLSLTKTISVGSTPTGEFLFVDFNTDSSLFSTALYEHRPFYLPPGPYSNDDVVYKDFLQKQSRLTYVDEGWVKKFPIYGELGSVESHPDWPTLGSSPGFYETGSGYLFLKQCYFYVNVNQSIVNIRNGVQLNQKAAIDLSYISEPTVVYPKNISYVTIYDIENPEELGVQCDGAGKVIESTFSGSTARYLIKLWSARDSYSTDGEYEKSPVATSHSVFLYNTQFWNDSLYTTLVYTSPTTIFKAGDVFTSSFIDGYSPNYNIVLNGDNSGYAFYHDIGTFKVGPNSRTNNAYQSSSKLDPYATNLPYTFVVVNSTEKQYFETTAFYSRNHLKNKRIQFTKTSMPAFKNTTIDRYISSRQSIDTTVDVAGLEDNTLPVQSINVSNLNATNSDNVLIK